MRFEKQVLHIAVVLALAGVGLGGVAQAQEVTKQPDEQDERHASTETALATVVVTAQKREQDVQSVPVAISVVSGEEIIDRGIDNSNDIQRLVPGLSGQQSGFSRPRWFIRGIGSNDPNLTTESPLGVYRDEIFTGLTSLQSFAIYDLERVEVLRGPQGTLWGKNTTAGAVNFISRRPSHENDGYVRLTAGDWGARGAQGAAGGSITDNLAGRVSFYHQQYDGYAKNLYNGEDGPSFEQSSFRVQLLGDLSDNLSALYKAEFGNRKPGGNYAHTVYSEAGGGDRYGFTPGYGAKPKADSDYYAGELRDDTDTLSHLLKLDWDLGSGYTFTSITGYDEAENSTWSTSGHPPTYVGVRDNTASRGATDSWQLSQEFRLVSPQENRLSWIAGLHYFRYRFDRDTANAIFEPANRSNYNRTWLKQDAESYAAFGSLKFNVTDRFALNGGLRWTEETKDINIHTIRSANAVYNNHASWWNPDALDSALSYDENISNNGKWSELTGDFTPEYFFSDNVLGYFRYARGYRSGGFGASIPVLNAAEIASGVQPYIPQVEPEYLDSYEFGVKSNWLNGQLQANATVYYYDHKDIQLNVQAPNPLNLVTPPSGAFSQNAASGEVKGLELELQWRPVHNLRIGGSFNITDAKYDDFNPILSVSGVTQEVDRSGNRYFRTPKYQANLDVEYRAPLPNQLGTLVLTTDWVYRSHQYYNAAQQGAEQGDVARGTDGNVYQSEWQEQDAYWLGNAKVAYEPLHGQTEYFVTVSNVLDKTYVVNSTAASPNYPVALGQPRFVNLGFTARF